MLSPELFASVLQLVREGNGLIKACATAGANRSEFYKRIDAIKESADDYAQARQLGLDAWSEQITDIADECESDLLNDAEGRPVSNPAAVHRARLRIDTRKWLMSKLAPKRYGDQLNVGVTGDVQVTTVDYAAAARAPGAAAPSATLAAGVAIGAAAQRNAIQDDDGA